MVAENDIPVKKVLCTYNFSQGDVLKSPIIGSFVWKVGEVFECKLGEPIQTEYDGNIVHIIVDGFHSSSKISHFGFFWINGGEKTLFSYGNNDVLCNAIIPAGSEYYLNEYGDYVSNKMKIIKVGEPIRKFFRFFLKD